MRLLIVFDGKRWFIRRVRVIEHDLDRDEKVYRCDQSLGGPFSKLTLAASAAIDIILGWKQRRLESGVRKLEKKWKKKTA